MELYYSHSQGKKGSEQEWKRTDAEVFQGLTLGRAQNTSSIRTSDRLHAWREATDRRLGPTRRQYWGRSTPEQARDAEVIRLRKENDDLKNRTNGLVNEMAEIRKRFSNTSDNGEAVRGTETPVPAPVDGTATSSKRSAVMNPTWEPGVLSAEVREIQQTLTALEDGLKQVTASGSLLTDSVRQIQVALKNSNRGLGALVDRIDAIEARMASPATVVHPLTVPAILREATLNVSHHRGDRMSHSWRNLNCPARR